MRKYQIILKPLAAASGEPGKWSFAAHGATYTDKESRDTVSPRVVPERGE